MSILVIAEHDNSEIKGATLNAVAAAQAIGSDVDILVAGANCGAAADAAAKIAGISKVLVADNAAYEFMLAENVAPLIAELAANYGHVLVPATTNGKNVLMAKTSFPVLVPCSTYSRSLTSVPLLVKIHFSALSTPVTLLPPYRVATALR